MVHVCEWDVHGVCDSQMFMVCEDVYGVDGVCDSGNVNGVTVGCNDV